MISPHITLEPNHIRLPGLATVHSHAFQRAMRGRVQRPTHKADSFWSWRGAMYQLARAITPDTMYAVARLAYLELALAGVTLVGEFHYLHHDHDGRPYANRTVMAEAVIEAAIDVGVRICLIRTAYLRGGFQQELSPAQKRFSDPSTDAVLEDLQTLESRYAKHPLVNFALAAHSIRATPLPAVQELSGWAAQQNLPFHMHLCEQQRELAECRAEYNVTPVQLLADHGLLNERFVAVHATHLSEAEIEQLGQNRSFVCLCRTTERDLGDGLPATSELANAGARLCVGVDSHCSENPFEEIRAVELDERSRLEARMVVGGADFLLDVATRQGYAACGLEHAWLEDQIALDRRGIAFTGLADEHLLDGVIFNASPSTVREVSINGQTIVQDGRHPKQEAIIRDYQLVIDKIF